MGIDLTQILTETQHQNNALKTKLNENKQEISKLNEKISSYSQQSQLQKKIVGERDLRIKELSSDLQETQNLLQKSTKTMKESYTEQMKQIQFKLDASNKSMEE